MNPPFRVVRALALFTLGLGLVGPASADPRWWWNDQAITQTRTDGFTPDITVGGGDAAGGQGGALFVTWSEVDEVDGDREIYVTASPDTGCTWCDPVKLTDDAIDDTAPRIAVGAAGGFLSIQIVFEKAGNVVVAYDASTIPQFFDPTTLCQLLADAGAKVIGNGSYQQLNSGVGNARSPDIAAASTFAFSHFHAVWVDTAAGRDEVWYGQDLPGAGGVGWIAAPVRSLTSLPGAGGRDARLDTDILTDPDPDTGISTTDRSAVNVVYVDSVTEQVMGLRSIDSGASFSPDGTRPSAAATAVSDAGSVTARPAIDTNPSPFSFTAPTWIVTAWDDFRAARAEPDIRFDARRMDAPTSPGPDWQLPDSLAATPPAADDGHPAVTAQPSFIIGPISTYVAWQDSAVGAREIFYRGGLLDETQPAAIDLSTFPIRPVRPLDPAASVATLLTRCDFDEATFGCVPARRDGAAASVAMASNAQAVYAVWADTRDGNSEIYFKKTDQNVFMGLPRVTAACSGLGEAYIDVEFQVPRTCPTLFANERMFRYRIYYGTSAGGPYDNAATPIEILHDASLGAVVTRRIAGLALGTGYFVIVVPEDEARNVFPADFEPTRDDTVSPPNEASTRTPDPCAPALSVTCGRISDSCPSGPSDGDGNVDFGELVEVEIVVRNIGTAPANGYTATVTAAGATVASPAGGVITIPTIPALGSATVRVLLDMPRTADGAACLDPVNLQLVNQTSDGSLTYPDDDLTGCDFLLGDPSGTCADCASFPHVVVTRCLLALDSCPLGGSGHDNGVVDPGEAVVIELRFENVSDQPAVDFQAQVDLLAGGVIANGGTVGPVTLPAGGSIDHRVTVVVLADCGELVAVQAVDLFSDGRTFEYPDATPCEHRIGTNPQAQTVVYADASFLFIPDGGSATSPIGVDPVEPTAVDRVVLTITGNFPNRPNLQATLNGPLGSFDVTAALGAPLDLTAEYNGATGGPGHYDLTVAEIVPDPAFAFVQEWRLSVTETTADCNPCVARPDIIVECALIADDCPFDATLDGDGQFDFGEEATVVFRMTNVGSAAATNYTATLAAISGGVVVSPPGGVISFPTIAPAGGFQEVNAIVRILRPPEGASCGDPVDLNLSGQQSDGGFTWPDNALPACDFTIGTPFPPCEDCVALVPNVAASCVIVSDRCPNDVTLDGDGQLDFGELVDMTITLTNSGGLAATGYTATLQVTGATLVQPAGGTVSVASIPAGGSRQVAVTLQLPRPPAATCRDAVNLTLVGQQSDAGAHTFPDAALPTCDFQIGDPSGNCSECVTPPFEVCLYRSDVTVLLPHTPPRTTVYLATPTAEGISLQGTPYDCPFATGDLEPDANALFNGVPLVLYQVNLNTDTLRLEKSGTTIEFTF